jgi:hypothetical protein
MLPLLPSLSARADYSDIDLPDTQVPGNAWELMSGPCRTRLGLAVMVVLAVVVAATFFVAFATTGQGQSYMRLG